MAELWREVVLELRWHWENLSPLNNVAVDHGPDMRFCLLFQKFQMLRLSLLLSLPLCCSRR